jgi:hypothetical protein
MGDGIGVGNNAVMFTESIGIADCELCADYDRIKKFCLTPTLVVDVRLGIEGLEQGRNPTMIEISPRRRIRTH